MDVYIYRTDEGEYLRLLGVTDRIARYDIERLLCGGDRLEAVFVTNSRDAELIKPDRLIEIPGIFSGLITGIKMADGGRTEVSAASFAGLLSRRVLVDYESGDSFMDIVEKNCGAPAGEVRAFPNTVIDKTADLIYKPSIADKNRVFSYAVNSAAEKGFRICSDIIHDDGGAKIRLYGRCTQDRSIGSGNLPVILSSEYDTLGRKTYSYSEKGTVNGAYIYSDAKYSGSGSVVCEAWSGYYGDAVGFGRCEESYKIEPVIYRSYSIIDGDIIYKASLDLTATKEAAADLFASRYSPPSEVITAPLGKRLIDLIRSKLFDVGDRVTLYPDEDGENSARRIMKMTEHYENGGFTMSVRLDMIKKEGE